MYNISLRWQASGPSLLLYHCLRIKADGRLPVTYLTLSVMDFTIGLSPFLLTRAPVWSLRPSPLSNTGDGCSTTPDIYSSKISDGHRTKHITYNFAKVIGCAYRSYHLANFNGDVLWLLPVTLEPDPCKLKFVSWLHPRAQLEFGSLLVDPAITQNRTQLISPKLT